MVGEACGHEEEVGPGVMDERGDVLFCGAVYDPEEVTVGGVITGDAHGAGDEHLGAVTGVEDGGGAVAACIIGALDSPDFGSCVLVEGDDIAIAVVVSVDDDEVVEEDGGATEAVDTIEGAGVGLPEGFTLEGESGDEHAVDIEEGGKDLFPVGGGGAGGVAIEAVFRFQR